MGTELIKQELGLQKPFESHEKKIIELALKRKVYLYLAVEAVESIKESILLAFALSGFKIDGENQQDKDREIAIMSGLLYERMIDVFPEVTLEEFRESVKRGVCEDYGKFHGLNVKTFMMFINGYLRSEQRLHKLKRYKEEKEEVPNPPVTVGEWKEIISSDFKTYKEGNKGLIIFHEKTYLLLIHLGLIVKEEEIDWEGHLMMGKEIFEQSKRLKAAKEKDASLLNQVSLFVERFDNDKMNDQDKDSIITATRKLRYFAYFDYCIKNNIENIFN